VSLNDPEVVAAEYGSEAGLEARRSVYEGAEGDDPRDIAFDAVAEVAPTRVLEVGAGPGEMSARIAAELSAQVVAIDLSPRMVELARARDVDARVADVEELPFDEESFDVVLAAWMLYHLRDLDRGLSEIARVLRPRGRLVAVTNSERHLEEIRTVAGVDMSGKLPFNRDNGQAILSSRFARVRRIDVDGWLTFPDAESIRRYVGSMITEKAKAANVPDDIGSVRAGRRVTVFVADKA